MAGQVGVDRVRLELTVLCGNCGDIDKRALGNVGEVE
jgi:hypothetical protein